MNDAMSETDAAAPPPAAAGPAPRPAWRALALDR